MKGFELVPGSYYEGWLMELLLICGIVVVAIATVTYRVTRTMRDPSPPCCGCDSCAQPEAGKSACCSEKTGRTDTAPDDSVQ